MRFRSFFISLAFVLILLPVALYLKGPLVVEFIQHNLFMNSLILGVFSLGIMAYCWQAFHVFKDFRWLDKLSKRSNGYSKDVPSFFLYLHEGDIKDGLRQGLSSSKVESIQKQVEKKVVSHRAFVRFTGGVLMFLGLLGTFWGLSQTVSSIATAIKSLASQDMSSGFEAFKIALIAPLSGMGTAFSSSLFGLLGTLLLSLLDIGLAKTYQVFLDELQLTLKSYVKDATLEKNSSGPAYLQGIMEQLCENMIYLQQSLLASEEGRSHLTKSIHTLNEKLSFLADDVKESQGALKKFSQNTYELQQALKYISQQLSTSGLDESSRQFLRSIDLSTKQLLQETMDMRTKMTHDLRSEIRLVARTISSLANQDAAA